MRPHKHWEQNLLYRIRLPARSLMCVSFSKGKKIFPWDTFGKSSTRNQSRHQLHQPILHTPESSPYRVCAKVWCKKTFSLLLKFALSFLPSFFLCFFVSAPCDQLTRPPSVSRRLTAPVRFDREAVRPEERMQIKPVFSAVPTTLPRLASKPGTLLRNSHSLLAWQCCSHISQDRKQAAADKKAAPWDPRFTESVFRNTEFGPVVSKYQP